tara:strand:- start:263 stop:955 length:693 start_codon:yes stop_codon:yes gene_type:complete
MPKSKRTSKVDKFLKALRLAHSPGSSHEGKTGAGICAQLLEKHPEIRTAVISSLEGNKGYGNHYQSSDFRGSTSSDADYFKSRLRVLKNSLAEAISENKELRRQNLELQRREWKLKNDCLDLRGPPCLPGPGLSPRVWWDKVIATVNPPVIHAVEMSKIPGAPSRAWLFNIQKELPCRAHWTVRTEYIRYQRWREIRPTTLDEVQNFLHSIWVFAYLEPSDRKETPATPP